MGALPGDDEWQAVEDMDHFRHQIPLLYSQDLLEMGKQMIGFALPGVIGPLGDVAAGSSMAAGGPSSIQGLINGALQGVTPDMLKCTDVADALKVGLQDLGEQATRIGERIYCPLTGPGGKSVDAYFRMFTGDNAIWMVSRRPF